MKKLISTLLFACALIATTALNAANFEGKVTMKLTFGKGEPMPMTYSLKEGYSRVDMTLGRGMSMALITDQPKQETIMLMPAQKMYKVTPLEKIVAESRTQVEKNDATLEKTSETEKILGYDCTKYLVKSSDGTSEIWITEQLGTFMGLGSGGNPMGGGRGGSAQVQAWEKALMGKNFFPLRTVVLGKDGKEAFRMEATAVEKQSLPASAFAVPADYQKLPDMGEMMKGMMPGMLR